jgi:hypothetical protein
MVGFGGGIHQDFVLLCCKWCADGFGAKPPAISCKAEMNFLSSLHQSRDVQALLLLK